MHLPDSAQQLRAQREDELYTAAMSREDKFCLLSEAATNVATDVDERLWTRPLVSDLLLPTGLVQLGAPAVPRVPTAPQHVVAADALDRQAYELYGTEQHELTLDATGRWRWPAPPRAAFTQPSELQQRFRLAEREERTFQLQAPPRAPRCYYSYYNDHDVISCDAELRTPSPPRPRLEAFRGALSGDVHVVQTSHGFWTLAPRAGASRDDKARDWFEVVLPTVARLDALLAWRDPGQRSYGPRTPQELAELRVVVRAAESRLKSMALQYVARARVASFRLALLPEEAERLRLAERALPPPVAAGHATFPARVDLSALVPPPAWLLAPLVHLVRARLSAPVAWVPANARHKGGGRFVLRAPRATLQNSARPRVDLVAGVCSLAALEAVLGVLDEREELERPWRFASLEVRARMLLLFDVRLARLARLLDESDEVFEAMAVLPGADFRLGLAHGAQARLGEASDTWRGPLRLVASEQAPHQERPTRLWRADLTLESRGELSLVVRSRLPPPVTPAVLFTLPRELFARLYPAAWRCRRSAP